MANSWELDANTIDFDDLKLGMRNNTYAQCPECLKYLVWDKIPHENILTYREYHGEPNLTPETIVTGFICVMCGSKIEF